MRLQTGLRVDANLWGAYREVCRREGVRPYQPIEEFLKSAVENNSTAALVHIVQEAAKFRAEGYNAYARVVLEWYTMADAGSTSKTRRYLLRNCCLTP